MRTMIKEMLRGALGTAADRGKERELPAPRQALLSGAAAYINEKYEGASGRAADGDDRIPRAAPQRPTMMLDAWVLRETGQVYQAGEMESAAKSGAAGAGTLPEKAAWDRLLSEMDAGFSETLLLLIDRSGMRDSEVYKKAGVDRKLFSKIRRNRDYQPSKATALAFVFALELDLDAAEDLLARAGYALSHSSKFDIIAEYFIVNGNYDIFELNQVLYAFDQPLLQQR